MMGFSWYSAFPKNEFINRSLRPHYEFFRISTFHCGTRDKAVASNRFPTEDVGVQLGDAGMIRVGGDDSCTTLCCTAKGSRKTLLISPREKGLVVFPKSIEIVLYDVGWIGKNEITSLRFLNRLFEITHPDIGMLK
jgi:hypothetical protein